MKAKFVNEQNVEDILKPKNYMEIHRNLFGSQVDEVIPFEDVQIGMKGVARPLITSSGERSVANLQSRPEEVGIQAPHEEFGPDHR